MEGTSARESALHVALCSKAEESSGCVRKEADAEPAGPVRLFHIYAYTRIYIYIYIHIRMYVQCVHASMCRCMEVCICVYLSRVHILHTCLHKCMHAGIHHANVQVYAHIEAPHTRLHMYMYICIYVHVYICVHLQSTYTYTHACICIHIHHTINWSAFHPPCEPHPDHRPQSLCTRTLVA